MLRMLWLRQRVPESRAETTMVSLDERGVVMSATVTLPDGGQGSGHAAAVIDDDTDLASAVELAETRALGRALDVLGYVVTESTTAGSQERPTSPRPTPREERRSDPPEHVRAIRSMREREHQRPEPATPAPVDAETGEIASSPGTPSTQDSKAPRPQPAANDDEEPALEDVSWTAFWGWARTTYQLSSKVQLEDLLGQPVGNKTPGELRQMLNAHFAVDSDDES